MGEDVKNRMLGSLSIETVEEIPKSMHVKMVKSLQNMKKRETETNDKNTSVIAGQDNDTGKV